MSKLFKIVLSVFVIVGLAVAGFYVYQNSLVKPRDILENSFKKMTTVSSFTTTMESVKAPFQLKIEGNFHFDRDSVSTDKLSLVSVQIFMDMPPVFSAQNFKFDFAFNKTDEFLSVFYSDLDHVLAQVKVLAPEIEKYKTYQLVMPILRGEKWLHVAIPKGSLDDNKANDLSADVSQGSAEQNENEKFARSFGDIFTYRKLDQNFQQDGKVFYRITIGIKKDKLLKMLSEIKDSTQLDIDLSDFNQFVKIVKAVDSWDSDLIEILVQKDDGMLNQIALNFPGLSKAELTKLAELASPESPMYKKPSEIKDLPKIDHVFTIKLDNYNTAPDVPKVSNFVEVEPIAEAVKVELLPLMGAYLQALGTKT